MSGKWYFSWKDLRSMLIFGWNDSAMFCVLPLLFPYCIENDDLPILDEEIALDDEPVMAFVGRVDDFLKQNAVPDSIRAYVVASLMERQTGKKHMIATSFNRNSFSFPISDGNGSSAS